MYDIGALSLLVTVGLTLVVTGVLAAGWRHRVLIWGLIVLGVFIVALALAWPLLAKIFPWLARQLSAVAISPSTWFTLFMFIAALVVFSRSKTPPVQGVFLPVDEKTGVPHISTPELARDLRGEITSLETRLTVSFLDWLISEAPSSRSKHVTDYQDAIARETQRGLMEGYVRAVRREIGDTQRGIAANEVLGNAERETEEALEKIPQDKRPPDIDPLHVRRYLISQMKCQRLVAFLSNDRNEVAIRAMRQRNYLLERKSNRDRS